MSLNPHGKTHLQFPSTDAQRQTVLERLRGDAGDHPQGELLLEDTTMELEDFRSWCEQQLSRPFSLGQVADAIRVGNTPDEPNEEAIPLAQPASRENEGFEDFLEQSHEDFAPEYANTPAFEQRATASSWNEHQRSSENPQHRTRSWAFFYGPSSTDPHLPDSHWEPLEEAVIGGALGLAALVFSRKLAVMVWGATAVRVASHYLTSEQDDRTDPDTLGP